MDETLRAGAFGYIGRLMTAVQSSNTDSSGRGTGSAGASTPAGWSRDFGPEATFDWLKGGQVVERIPKWFIDFFLATREIGAVRPGETDNCTMTTVEDNWCLYRIVQLVRPSKSLEIGIMRGSSSITIGKALLDAGIDCIQTAVDIDPLAADAAARHFNTYRLGSRYVPVVADSRKYIASSGDRWQFVFLDGDHTYDTVALEFAEAYNRTDPGGCIVLHDTGSKKWGVNEDPGWLFFDVLDGELGQSAEMGWLDSTSCDVDMKLRTSLGLFPTLPQISTGISVGFGGLGIVRKLDSEKSMSVERLLSRRRSVKPVFTYPQKQPTPIGRLARRIASGLGI